MIEHILFNEIAEEPLCLSKVSTIHLHAPIWFVDAAFLSPNTQQLLKTPVKSSLLHKIGCGSEKQLNKFIDFSLALHNFYPQTLAQLK